jgi:hypothetical protein
LCLTPIRRPAFEGIPIHLSPDAEERIRNDFNALVNLEPAELRAWLKTPESHRVGMVRPGETESVARQSAKKIRPRPRRPRPHEEVVGYRRRHLAQRPWGDVPQARWRWSLMNWGHDPLRGRKSG